ncbi:glycerate kinase [Desulfopila sp. IMCC35008]|uniref:glycerate kinase n=1 Tax=Desulfopila sp. IMCC35008 TaxID=2653858 RepID=UPI0013CF9CC1|nr:glycerate kinase [Desulfopila sp. IMCC35008]
MRIVAAPNAFKGSLSAHEAAEAISRGVLRGFPDCEVIQVPVADGGDGLLEIATDALGGEVCDVTVKGPDMQEITSSFGWVRENRVAVIEMASASGLAILPEAKRDPTLTTTFGTGELILAALDKGAQRIIVGLGGSATCDGGIGMATSLGYRFLDEAGNALPPIGKSLQHIVSIDTSDIDQRLAQVVFDGVCDVTNPLTGENGASHVYSPQKGASAEQVLELDEGLSNLADVIKREMGMDIRDVPGAGAAGGLGAGLHCFLSARLEKGIDLVLDLVELEKKIQGADLVITGEGQIDFQTRFDKAPAGVARLANRYGIPCIAICGSIGEKIHELYETGIISVFSICSGPLSLQEAMDNGAELVEKTAEQVIRTYLARTY